MNNLFVTVSPNIVNLKEYESFNQSFTIDYTIPAELVGIEPATYDYNFYDVTYDPTLSSLSTMAFTKTGNFSFSMNGTFNDVFDRKLKYVTIDGTKYEVPHFGELPSTMGGLYSYTPPSVNTINFVFNVRMKPNSGVDINPPESSLHLYPITFIVHLDRSNDNKYFAQNLARGEFYNTAKSKGYIE